MGCCPVHESCSKANSIFKFTLLNFCLLTHLTSGIMLLRATRLHFQFCHSIEYTPLLFQSMYTVFWCTARGQPLASYIQHCLRPPCLPWITLYLLLQIPLSFLFNLSFMQTLSQTPFKNTYLLIFVILWTFYKYLKNPFFLRILYECIK